MRLRLILLLGVFLGPAGVAPAQTLIPAPTGGPVEAIDWTGSQGTSCSRMWGSAEYLLWWTKSSPLPVPLVTTASAADPALGALGGATTRLVIGDENLGFDARSGGRFTLGGWLDDNQLFGLEGNFFFLSSATVTRSASVDGFSQQVISVPFFDQTPGGLFGAPQQENGFVVGAPAGIVGKGFAGITTLSIQTQLLGAEANGVFNLARRDSWRLDGLAGFRYVHFQENLEFDTSSPTVVPATPGEYFLTTDHFNGRTDFYGGQMGARLSWDFGPLTLAATAKVAMGVMDQQLDVNGSLQTNDFNTPFGTGPGRTFPGGYFALPSNSGDFHHDHFGVVPEADLNMKYQFTQHLGVSLGYTFMYLNSVVRPGEQIDRNINGGQSSLYSYTATPPGLQGGPAQPAPMFHTTDFWAQGINFGFEVRY